MNLNNLKSLDKVTNRYVLRNLIAYNMEQYQSYIDTCKEQGLPYSVIKNLESELSKLVSKSEFNEKMISKFESDNPMP